MPILVITCSLCIMARPRYPDLNCEALEAARRNKGLTLNQLAHECYTRGDRKLDQAALSRYERGEVRPSPERLRTIAGVLGVDEADLLAPRIAA